MKIEAWIVIVVAIVAFSLGYFIRQPEETEKEAKTFDSCKSAYQNLVESDICKGKLGEHIGSGDVVGYVEWFDWNRKVDSVIDPHDECYTQAYVDYVLGGKQKFYTGERKTLINCVAHIIDVVNGTLKIQCGCFFE